MYITEGYNMNLKDLKPEMQEIISQSVNNLTMFKHNRDFVDKAIEAITTIKILPEEQKKLLTEKLNQIEE